MAHWQYNMLTQGAVEVLSWPPDYGKGLGAMVTYYDLIDTR